MFQNILTSFKRALYPNDSVEMVLKIFPDRKRNLIKSRNANMTLKYLFTVCIYIYIYELFLLFINIFSPF